MTAHANALGAASIGVSACALAIGTLLRGGVFRYLLVVPVGVLFGAAIVAATRRAGRRRESGEVRPGEIVLHQVVVWMGVGALMGVTLGLASALPMVTWMLPVMVGVSLIAAGVGARVGKEQVCAKCDYPFIEPTESDPSPEVCPECGAAWLRPDGTRAGRGKRVPVLAWAGAAVLTVGVLAFAWRLQGVFGLARHMPTGLLVMQAVNGQGGGFYNWKELETRKLDAAQVRRLATALLDDRRSGLCRRRSEGNSWLDAQMLAGTLPPDLVQRFYEDTFSPRLFAPATARVGVPLTVRLSGAHETIVPALGLPRLYLEGFYAGDEPVPREDGGRVGSMFFPHEITYIRHPEESPDDEYFLKSPSVTFTPDKPGPVVVRARGYICYGAWGFDRSVKPSIAPDGTMTPPPGSIFARELDVETTVQVAP
ncbi:MAG: hypothetical protein IT438_14470 [Phycisphaerales bacterium]|nr:hypothetical protein [Phycisphaerales bacterium]